MNNNTQQEPYDLTLGDRTFRMKGVYQDCAFEILVGDDGDIHLICAASARAYALTRSEAEAFANDLLHTVAQTRSTPASPAGDDPQQPSPQP